MSALPILSTVAAVAGVSRQWGANRYATAADVSNKTFSPGVAVVYVATGTNFPDALAAGPAASAGFGPVLLVTPTSIPAETAAELDRLNPVTIVIAGGTGVVNSAVQAQLGAYSSSVTRQSGANRYATAADVSAKTFSPGVAVAYVATGTNFPDALAAGPAAGKGGGPVLLVTPTSIPAETATELDRLNPLKIVIAGGTGVVSSAVQTQLGAYAPLVTRQAGANRYATAADVSLKTFAPGVDVVYVATGTNFPDALAAGPAASKGGGPVLLVTTTSIPPETATELDRLNPTSIVIAGGTGVVSSTVEAQLAAYIGGPVNGVPNAIDDNIALNRISGCPWQYRVLTNDTDADGDLLSITAVSDPPHGTAGILTNRIGGVEVPRVVSYVSDGGYTGADSFTYTVSDGHGGADTATVNLNLVAGGADADGDLIVDECDAFQTDSSNASGQSIPFELSFSGGAGGIEDAGFTGVMTNALSPLSILYDPAQVGLDGSGHFVVNNVPEGDAVNGNNNGKNGFQVNVTTPLSDFTVHGSVCGPYPTQQFASAGIFFGTGDQDNFIKAVVHGSAFGSSVHDSREVNGEGTGIATKPDANIAAAACVDLYLFVNATTHTYVPSYSLNGGATRLFFTGGVPGARTVPASWIDGSQPLAVGIISTSNGPAAPFTATWDFLGVAPGPI